MAQMIVINNPNNPTGATISKGVLGRIVDLARARGIIILSDEVYRPLFHSLPSDEEMPPSVLEFGYEKTIATGSLSKAYSLAGIRLGWIASRDKSIIEAVATARDYTTISVSQLSDQVASYALSDVQPALLKRNVDLARTNLEMLDAFVKKHSSNASWVKPTAGTTAFIQFADGKGQPVEDVWFCLDVLEKTKVMFLPGSKCFGHDKDFKGFVRIGYVCETEVLEEALDKLSSHVEKTLS